MFIQGECCALESFHGICKILTLIPQGNAKSDLFLGLIQAALTVFCRVILAVIAAKVLFCLSFLRRLLIYFIIHSIINRC